MPEFSTSMPITEYRQAVWQLAKFQVSHKHTHEQLALAVSIVADIYWYSEAKVRHDVDRAVRSVSAEDVSPARRRYVSGAMRRAVY